LFVFILQPPLQVVQLIDLILEVALESHTLVGKVGFLAELLGFHADVGLVGGMGVHPLAVGQLAKLAACLHPQLFVQLGGVLVVSLLGIGASFLGHEESLLWLGLVDCVNLAVFARLLVHSALRLRWLLSLGEGNTPSEYVQYANALVQVLLAALIEGHPALPQHLQLLHVVLRTLQAAPINVLGSLIAHSGRAFSFVSYLGRWLLFWLENLRLVELAFLRGFAVDGIIRVVSNVASASLPEARELSGPLQIKQLLLESCVCQHLRAGVFSLRNEVSGFLCWRSIFNIRVVEHLLHFGALVFLD